MEEKFCTVGEVELCYETFGSPSDPTVLLVMGLGTQMIAWRTEFCERLAARGFQVVRYDNRDCGRSTRFDDHPVPRQSEIFTRRIKNPAYSLADMAADGIGLLDHLGVERAHIAGVSMGGMITQQIGVDHPERVLSLASIMSTTGSQLVGQATPLALKTLLTPAPTEREGFVQHLQSAWMVIGSPGFEKDAEDVRELAENTFDRGIAPAGTARQLAAIIAAGNRTASLRTITAPTLVLHGERDILIRASGGRATARAIPTSRYVQIAGMGHDLPRGAWDRMIDAIVDNASAANPLAAAAASA